MATIFSKIVAGEIPCYKVAETEHCFAFLDINPVVRGHVLLFAKRVAKGLKKVCPCIKVGEAVVGIDVPHVHIHLMPLNRPGDLNFSHHVEMNPDELKALAAEIAAAIE